MFYLLTTISTTFYIVNYSKNHYNYHLWVILFHLLVNNSISNFQYNRVGEGYSGHEEDN